MKTTLLILLVMFLMPVAWSQLHVTPADPGLNLQDLGPVKLTQGEPELPPRDKREKFFARYPAALKHMKQWDELDKDMLWLSLKNYPLPQLQQKYPAIPAETLRQMKQGLK